MAENEGEQGQVNEPETEDAAGAQETPGAEQLSREQQIVGEPLDESLERAAEETSMATGRTEDAEEAEEFVEETPRQKPAIPGMDLEVDIVPEGEEALGGRPRYSEDEDYEEVSEGGDADDELPQVIAEASIDLAAGARYRATGKRKTAVARVTLKPGTGEYSINGKTLEVFFPRHTLQRTIRQPLETVGYETRMDVVASMHGGGVSAQAGALRHGVSRALLEADPNLRSELKRRGFLTRDARVKERKKAGLKKARKRPQFSKR